MQKECLFSNPNETFLQKCETNTKYLKSFTKKNILLNNLIETNISFVVKPYFIEIKDKMREPSKSCCFYRIIDIVLLQTSTSLKLSSLKHFIFFSIFLISSLFVTIYLSHNLNNQKLIELTRFWISVLFYQVELMFLLIWLSFLRELAKQYIVPNDE